MSLDTLDTAPAPAPEEAADQFEETLRQIDADLATDIGNAGLRTAFEEFATQATTPQIEGLPQMYGTGYTSADNTIDQE